MAGKPLNCEGVKSLALQKIIAIGSADTRGEPVSNWSSAAATGHDVFRAIGQPKTIARTAIKSSVEMGLADFMAGNKSHDMLLRFRHASPGGEQHHA